MFFQGCPLSCWWCHNPEGQEVELSTDVASDGEDTAEQVFREIQKDVIFYDQSRGGATFSGGEPLLQVDLLYKLLQLCRENGIHTAVDTCGCVPFDRFEKIYDAVDMFLYDLKIMDPSDHVKYTGASNDLILENLRKLSEKEDTIRIRIPMVPGITDTDQNLNQIAEFALSLKHIHGVDLLPYNQFGKGKYAKLNRVFKLGDLQPQTTAMLKRQSKIFSARGLNVAF